MISIKKNENYTRMRYMSNLIQRIYYVHTLAMYYLKNWKHHIAMNQFCKQKL